MAGTERMIIGMRLAYEICRYCGEKFCYNGCRPEQRSGAFKEKRKHESACPVRFGREECSKDWAETLARKREEIESSQKIINELTEGLRTGGIHLSLREKAVEIIEEEKRKIRGCKRFMGEDPDFEEIKKDN